MKKVRKIPTIIGLVFLIFGLAAGVLLVNTRQLFKLGATGEGTPRSLKITNIAKDSVVVSWLTDVKNTNFINYSEKPTDLTLTQTETGETSKIHLIKLLNLKPETTYYFKIGNGKDVYDNNGAPWQITTVSESEDTGKTEIISGTILTATSSPAKALVFARIEEEEYATLTSENGSWVLPIPAKYPAETIIDLSAQGGEAGVATAQIKLHSAKPVPTMILGEVYDFKNLPPSEKTDLPAAGYNAPLNSAPDSGFKISNSATLVPENTTVTLESIEEGEIIATQNPEFLGQGPVGMEITITVESEKQEAEVTVKEDGSWSWSPPESLPEGIHKVTIAWKDATGITRTITRNFVVEASEGPAYVASGSATPTSSASPTVKPTGTATATPKVTATPTVKPTGTGTPTATASATPTPPPQPVSGALTPTIVLSIMGIGFIAFAFLFWKESNARSS